MNTIPTNDTFRHINAAALRAHERAEELGVAYFVTGGANDNRGGLSVICSNFFDPGDGQKIAYAAWPKELTRCRK